MNIDKKTHSKRSFTLAEMLITLTVISVVAIITLPALLTNVEDFKWNASRQKMVYNIREAARRMSFNNAGGIGGFGTAANFRDELAKYLAVSKSCDTVTDCFPANIKDIAGTNISAPTSGADLGLVWGTGNPVAEPGNAAGMILSNGASMNIIYNTACNENTVIYDGNNNFGQNHVCANIIFDLNGFTSPNQTGKDIGFVSIINPKNTSVVGPIPDTTDLIPNQGMSAAQTNCMSKGYGLHLPTKNELNSIYYNKKIIGNLVNAVAYWSSSEYTADTSFAWVQYSDIGDQFYNFKTIANKVRCVR